MDPNEPTDVIDDDIPQDNPSDAPEGDDPSSNPTGNSGDPEQQLTPEQIAALQTENNRLRGTVSSLTKKVRGAANTPQSAPSHQGEDPIDYRTYNATLKMASVDIRQQLEDSVIGLYQEGSDQIPQGDAALPQSEVNWIMRNMWAYVSDAAKDAIVYRNNLEPALLDIEQAMADRAALLSKLNSNQTSPNPIIKRAGGKQVNPSPAPMVPSKNGKPQAEDLWRMPMQDLEKRASQAKTDLASE